MLATQGVSVNANGTKRLFKGALLAFLGDNLASNALGGFKLSFSFSFRCCRTCLILRETISECHTSDKLVM